MPRASRRRWVRSGRAPGQITFDERLTTVSATAALAGARVRRPRRRTRMRVLLCAVGAVVLVAAVAWYEIEANPLGGPAHAS